MLVGLGNDDLCKILCGACVILNSVCVIWQEREPEIGDPDICNFLTDGLITVYRIILALVSVMLLVAENIFSLVVNIGLCSRIVNRNFFLLFGIGVGVCIAAEPDCCGIDDLVCFFGPCDCCVKGPCIVALRAGKGRLCACVVVRPAPYGFAVGMDVGLLFDVGVSVCVASEGNSRCIDHIIVFLGFCNLRINSLLMVTFRAGEDSLRAAVVV